MKEFNYEPKNAVIALEMDDYFVWDCSVIYAEGKYHMFSSRWKKEYGFGWNWLYNSEIIQSVSDKPEGPYKFLRVVLPRRGRQYFDGMNTHNTCIKYYNGKYYLYYMGTTYDDESPTTGFPPKERNLEVWNSKRIGLAVADSIYGEFVRKDKPILLPRDESHWDCTVTTNPTVAILPSGKTYMIYKSRKSEGATLKLGVAVADCPEGEYKRLSDRPIFDFDNPDLHIEDPFLWYDNKRKKFCLLVKDDSKNGSYGITGEWGSGFYAESDDCVNFVIPENPKVFSRTVTWKDGKVTTQGNMERVSLLFDENGTPTHMFNASADGCYGTGGRSYIVCQQLVKKD